MYRSDITRYLHLLSGLERDTRFAEYRDRPSRTRYHPVDKILILLFDGSPLRYPRPFNARNEIASHNNNDREHPKETRSIRDTHFFATVGTWTFTARSQRAIDL